MTGTSLAVAMIGQALAQARGLVTLSACARHLQGDYAACRSTTPYGTPPVVTMRQRAMSSLRANPTDHLRLACARNTFGPGQLAWRFLRFQ
jgi:hypothetical protein